MKISRDNFDKIAGRIPSDAVDPVFADKKVNKDPGAPNNNNSSSVSLPKDIVQISAKAKAYFTGKNFVRSAIAKAEESASQEKLLLLKKEVAAGKYYISSDKIADAILGGGKKST